ncbi:NAD(+) diphosphatase [Bosea beijingensis]
MQQRNLFPVRPYFAHGPLDRAAQLRTNPATLARLRSERSARFLVYAQRRHLLSSSACGEGRLARLELADLGLAAADLEQNYWLFMGLEGDAPLFGIDLGSVERAHIKDESLVFAELRPYEFYLERDDAALAAHVRAMVNWRASHRFCSVCGAPTTVDQGGYHLMCGNGHEHFPRTDPVVVILVHHADRVLLAKGTRFPNKRLMSALSGFVEPAETLEEAVVREAFEEVGIRARYVTYHSSQPWPFPGMLMMGFLVEAESTDLALDAEEIVEARWLGRDQVKRHEELGFDPPDPHTLAGQLLLTWMSG